MTDCNAPPPVAIAPASKDGAVAADSRAHLLAELDRLRRENAVLRETVDSLDGTLVVYDSDSRYVLGNRRYHEHFPHLPHEAELIGRTYEEVLGLSLAAGVSAHPNAFADTAAYIAQRSAAFRARNLQPRESYDAARDRWYLIRSAVTPTGNVVALRIDITDQKRLQGELLAAREAADAAAAVKSRFLGGISHELRMPLNAIINFAHLLGEQLGPSPARNYAQEILDSGWQLQRLIAELLDLGRAEAGRLTLRDDAVDVERLAASACRLVAAEAAEAGVSLRCDIAPGLPMVCADEIRLRQALTDLLANAVRHSPAGGEVAVEAGPDQRGVRIVVTDAGTAFDSNELAQALKPFELGMPPPSGRAGRLGLGLALAHYVLAVQGGELDVTGSGTGTQATLFLPLARAA